MEFPTQAEKCLAEWQAITDRTVALVDYARKSYNTFRADEGTAIVIVFADGTIIRATGRGPSYRAIAELP